MERDSSAPRTTRSSRRKDGERLEPWRSVRVFSAKKSCLHCGAEYRPWVKGNRVEKEAPFAQRKYCSISCSKKHANPMMDPASRKKMAETLRTIGHRPKVRGGNGTPLPAPHAQLLKAMGPGWEAEVAVPTGIAKGNGYPTCYKVDIGHREMMVAIEVDGFSHCARKRQEQDRKKEALLKSLGWSVYRVSNAEAMSLSSTFRSQDILRILRKAS